MKYNTLGRSNLMVSKVCLGTMHFGPYASEEESFRILDRALELGINFWDTANVYGGSGSRGRSEEIIGNWFAARPGGRDRVVLPPRSTTPWWTMTSPMRGGVSLRTRCASMRTTPCDVC